jgi:hypothetical protein
MLGPAIAGNIQHPGTKIQVRRGILNFHVDTNSGADISRIDRETLSVASPGPIPVTIVDIPDQIPAHIECSDVVTGGTYLSGRGSALGHHRVNLDDHQKENPEKENRPSGYIWMENRTNNRQWRARVFQIEETI